LKSQGQRIKELRDRNKWTQDDLARRISQIYGRKVKQQSIQQLEIDKVSSPHYWSELCQTFGVDSDELRNGLKETTQGDIASASTVADPSGGYLSGNVVVRRVLSELAAAFDKNDLTEADILLLGHIAERIRKPSPK